MLDQLPIQDNAAPDDLERSIKAIEEALRESEDRYKKLIQTLPAAIYCCDPEGRITLYNEAAVKLWGREPQAGVDRWCGSWKIFNTDGTPLPLEECPMAVALRQQTVITGTEIIIEKPDGTRRFVKPHPQPFFDNKGNFVGATNLLIDITDNKNAEEQSAYMAAIVNSSDDAIISKTLNGIITSWNNSAERIFGYTAAEMIGQNISKIIPGSRRQEELDILRQLKLGQRVEHFETQRLRKDRQLLDISVTISPIFNSAGKIIGASKIARDITFQKKAEKIIREQEEQFRVALEYTVRERTHELVLLNERLAKSNHDLEQFAYIASHDLQEPLRKILTFADIIGDSPASVTREDQVRYLRKICSSADQMARLIKDVLHYSRLSGNEDHHVSIDLNGLFREVLMEFDLLAEQKGAVIRLQGLLPVVTGIPTQLKQLFRNLLSNSLKFCEHEPVITIAAHTGKQETMIIFKDNGIGFEQAHADKIFHIFNRLNSRTKYTGTGVGLALCKKIAENHQGSIRAESTPGEGSTFYIQLPV